MSKAWRPRSQGCGFLLRRCVLELLQYDNSTELLTQLQARVDIRTDSEATTPSLVDEITHSNLSSPASDKGIMVKQEESDDDGHLVECFKCLSIDKQHRHYMGRSSNFALIKTAIDLKQEVVRNRDSSEEPVAFPSRRPEFWDFSSV